MNKGERVLSDFWELFQKKMALESFYMKDKLGAYSPSEIHCIQYIGENPLSNVTKLADAFRMTTGGVTKLTKKLISKGLIETYKNPNNKKEIYFCLTGQGQEIYKIHQTIHQGFCKKDNSIFQQITDEEYACIFHFVKLYSTYLDDELQKVDVDIKSGIADKF